MTLNKNGLNIFSCTFEEVNSYLNRHFGKGGFHGTAICREVFKKGNLPLENIPEFLKSESLRQRILSAMTFPNTRMGKIFSKSGVTKFETIYEDGACVESVIIPMRTYDTLCISSQSGCKLACKFCKTGKMGFIRNLETEEIIAQVYSAIFILKKPVRNIVFMGMGEPFDNIENVFSAIRVLSDQKGFDIALRHITISTAGLPQGISRLGRTGWKNINLAISLNAPNDEIRSKLMPVNNTYPMDQLKAALCAYPLKPRGFFFVEYVLIKGVNDSRENACELASYLSDLPVRLNVIPFNPVPDAPFKAPTDDEVHLFSSYLEEKKIFVRKRWKKGSDIITGCGQLGTI